MKKQFLILALSTAFLAGCTLQKTAQPTENTTTPTPVVSELTPPEASDSTTQSESTYTLAQVAEHATADDCWFVLNGSVYDVTEFIAGGKHPGGEQIVKGCGKDATQMFESIKGGQGHPDTAFSFADQFKIGTLAE